MRKWTTRRGVRSSQAKTKITRKRSLKVIPANKKTNFRQRSKKTSRCTTRRRMPWSHTTSCSSRCLPRKLSRVTSRCRRRSLHPSKKIPRKCTRRNQRSMKLNQMRNRLASRAPLQGLRRQNPGTRWNNLCHQPSPGSITRPCPASSRRGRRT